MKIIKKRATLLVLLFAAMTFAGCKKDKDSDEKTPDNIVGKWYQTSSLVVGYKNGTELSRQNYTDFTDNDFTEFKSDGTAVDSDGDKYTYQLTATKLVIKKVGDNDSVQTFDVKTLSSAALVLYNESTETVGSDQYRTTTEGTFKKK